jgi:arylsulfatase A-like enzyme
MFTGLYARQHGAHYIYSEEALSGETAFAAGLKDRFLSIAELLQEKGYYTIGIVANKAYLGYNFGLDQGFEYYDARSPVTIISTRKAFYVMQGISNVLRPYIFPYDPNRMYRNAETINREIRNLHYRLRADGRPFFLFLNYMDAHTPYVPPPPFDSLYPGKSERFQWSEYQTLREKVISRRGTLTAEEVRHLVSQYDGGIAYLDFHLGKLIQHLKQDGLFENCLIIIISDHGESFGERHLLEHGVSVYQEQIYIPLLIKYPHSKTRVVSDETVSVVDLFPTVLDVLGERASNHLAGLSLLSLDSGRPVKIVSETFPPPYLVEWNPSFDRIGRAIFEGQYKFIRTTAGGRELYDLASDPKETRNLFSEDDDISRGLEEDLDQWLKMLKEEVTPTTDLTPQAVDQLRSLGYVQ